LRFQRLIELLIVFL